MNASELIKELEKAIAREGDLPVYVHNQDVVEQRVDKITIHNATPLPIGIPADKSLLRRFFLQP